jgi:2-polyprenyl-6-methoxyphenol hydroxylase-like FAD-dependent oxidoreductase
VRERGKTGERQSLFAELVVDASGHTSKVISWLSLLGYPAPETEALNVSLGYSTRYYKVLPDLADPKSTILVEGDPSKGMATAAFGMIENNLAELVIYRAGGAAYPSTDGDRFEKEVTELISPLIAAEVQKLEPLEEPRGFRVMKSLRHHFEQMAHWPQGLLVIGDAMCNFDPIHGQGMTIAAMEAEILGNALAEQRINPQPDFEVRVLQQMQTALESAWWLTLVADLRWPGVEYKGHLSLQGVAFAQKFFDLYLKEAFGRGNMELFGIYYMMVALVISPRQIIKAETFKNLLANDDSAEAEQLRAEFFPMGGTQAEIEKVEGLLEQWLPTFARGVELADMQQPA